jgi:hydroxylamine reductase
MSMFCFQCQEAAKGVACTGLKGVCGVTHESIGLQDLLVHLLKGLSVYTTIAREKGYEDNQVNRFVSECLFATITNANFTQTDFLSRIKSLLKMREDFKNSFIASGGSLPAKVHPSATWHSETDEKILQRSKLIDGRIDAPNDDIRSLRALTLYGLKGMAAYAVHAQHLGYEDNKIYAHMQSALMALNDDSLSLDDNINLVLETGKFGVDIMALLDKAHNLTYGSPEITKVKLGVSTNPGILISGHDLKDLEQLLEQTQGTGVDVYTHSEMLPAHYYPAFKKYTNFIGNYGNAWWKQREEFEKFNGPILFTTNCLVPPSDKAPYKDKVYTTGVVGYDGLIHIPMDENGKKDFSAIIEHAKKCESPIQIEDGEITGGFAHAQVFALADKVVDAVKSGAIRKFIVMAGCDGRMKDRNYYTEFAEKLPTDTVILTAGCAKYRYNKLPLGDIGGIPRVLDAGQCNDSYSLAVIALKLKEVFKLNDINELPIAYNIAWYEQKAVIVLLALLYLGVKNIHLGPTLPAFISPNVAKVLVENFGISSINTVDEDIKLLVG